MGVQKFYEKIQNQTSERLYGKPYDVLDIAERRFVNAYMKDFAKPEWKRYSWEGKETNYEVSNIGQVHNWKQNSKVDIRENRAGILTANIKIDGQYHQIPVHRMVAQLFVPNPDNKPEVFHKNGQRWLNWYKNLEWTTREEMAINGIGNIGIRGTSTKHTEEDVINVVKLAKEGMKIKDIVAQLGVTESFVIGILYRGEWKSVTHGLDLPEVQKATESEKIHEACKLLEQGMAPGIIATEVGISAGIVYAIRAGKAHRYISNQYNIPGLERDESITEKRSYQIQQLFAEGIMDSTDIINKLGMEDTRGTRKYISRLRQKFKKENK